MSSTFGELYGTFPILTVVASKSLSGGPKSLHEKAKQSKASQRLVSCPFVCVCVCVCVLAFACSCACVLGG